MSKEEASEAINLCLELLNSEDKWNKHSVFEEKCNVNSENFTLGCALELMQIKVLGKHKSWNLVMRKVRGKIYRYFFWRAGFHPLTYFNKHKRTTYEDIIFVLQKVKEEL